MKKLIEHKDGLGVWAGEYIPDPNKIYKEVMNGEYFLQNLNLYEKIKANTDFTVGKQWQNLLRPDVPALVLNFLGQVVNHSVAVLCSDDISMQATALRNVPHLETAASPITILSNELQSLNKLNNTSELFRDMAYNAAVRGSSCLYTYWDEEDEIPRTEYVNADKVLFGDPNNADVESQPYIIIEEYELVRNVKREAKDNGIEDWDCISTDTSTERSSSIRLVSDKVTTYLSLWKDNDGKVWAYKSTRNHTVKEPWCLEIERYPITWFSWYEVDNNYFGESLITGLIPAQCAVNKMLSLMQLAMLRNGFPTVVYNQNMVQKWTSDVGCAIATRGDVTQAARVIEAAPINPQLFQLVTELQTNIKETNGLTKSALGGGTSYNSSAIIASQKAAETSLQDVKRRLNRQMTQLCWVWVEFIKNYYGKRQVESMPSEEMKSLYQFSGMEVPSTVTVDFNFKDLEEYVLQVNIEVGSSAYYSEIAQMSTLDNLVINKLITPSQYVERVSNGLIPYRDKLIAELRTQEQANAQMAAQQSPVYGADQQAPSREGDNIPNNMVLEPKTFSQKVNGTGGYSSLQRTINGMGDVPQKDAIKFQNNTTK